MQAIIQTTPGGADTLVRRETSRPQPGPSQLLVRVHAAGVNRADIVQREGRYPPPPGASPILGLEVAGTVAERGSAIDDFAVGDAVFGLVAGGGYAEYVLLDAACAIAKPDWLSFEEAASLPEAWMTAWLNLVDLAGLKAGERALIHAGASGVGAAAIQLCGLVGAEAYATAGSAAKCGFCEALGAKRAIDYKQADFAERIQADGGVDVILDCVGGDYLARNIASLRPDGRLVTIGIMGGGTGQLDLGRLLVKRITVRGSTLRPQPLSVKAQLTRALRETVLPALHAGKAKVTLDRLFDWEDVAAAHRHVESNANLGKVVLCIFKG